MKNIYKYWTTVKDINPNFLAAQYAVRGLVPATAAVIQGEINKGVQHPFDSITELNIGNPMTYGQKPISFNRSVISAVMDPTSLGNRHPDVQRRAQYYIDSIGTNLGAYSASPGYSFIREAVAKFIAKRDGTTAVPDINNIILTDGASQGITLMFQLLLKDKSDGVMIPIPQYPLYSAVITQCGAQQIPYYLSEQLGWSVTVDELRAQYDESVKKGIKPKIIVTINPGNPTGQVFEKEAIHNIIKFAEEKKLIIFADEVYQENVYNPQKKFISFRQVSQELSSKVELYSFHTISKGITGECGLRGGYLEISNPIDTNLHAEIQKTKTIALCPNTVGQLMTGLMVTPPTKEEGCQDQTVDKYNTECNLLFQGLKQRAAIVTDYLNQTNGVSSQPIEGAMYAFPKIELTDKFIAAAKSLNVVPDVHYCLQLLKETGLVVVPGSGFHQYPGTNHFRMTILILPEEKLLAKMKVFKQWHEKFMKQF